VKEPSADSWQTLRLESADCFTGSFSRRSWGNRALSVDPRGLATPFGETVIHLVGIGLYSFVDLPVERGKETSSQSIYS